MFLTNPRNLKRTAPASQEDSDSSCPHKALKQEPEPWQYTSIPNADNQILSPSQHRRRHGLQRTFLKREDAVDLEEGYERSIGEVARDAQEAAERYAFHSGMAHDGGIKVFGGAPAVAAETMAEAAERYYLATGARGGAPAVAAETTAQAAARYYRTVGVTGGAAATPVVAVGARRPAAIQYYHTSYGGNDDSERDQRIMDWANNVFGPGNGGADDAAAQTGALDQTPALDAEQEIDLGAGDMPDAYCCPISAYVMLDPVILPTSGVTVDRKSIADWLLTGDGEDPFSKLPLRIEDVVPDATLKTRIEIFRAKRAAALAAQEKKKSEVDERSIIDDDDGDDEKNDEKTDSDSISPPSYCNGDSCNKVNGICCNRDHFSEPPRSLHYDGSTATHISVDSCDEKSDCICRACRIASHYREVRRGESSKPLRYGSPGEDHFKGYIDDGFNDQSLPSTSSRGHTDRDHHSEPEPSLHYDGSEASSHVNARNCKQTTACFCHACRIASRLSKVYAANAIDEPIAALSCANPNPAQHKPKRGAQQPAPADADSSHNDASLVDAFGNNEGSGFSDEEYQDENDAAHGSQDGSEPPSLIDDGSPSDKDPTPSEVHTESDDASDESTDESSSEDEQSEKEQSFADDESSSNEDPTSSEVEAHNHGSEGSCGDPECDDCHPENVFGQPAPSSSSASSDLGNDLIHVDRDFDPEHETRLDYGDGDQNMEDAGATAGAGTGETGNGDLSEHSAAEGEGVEGEQAENENSETQQSAPLVPGQGYVSISRAEQQQADLFFRVSDGKSYGDEEQGEEE
jgi:hypothetical protein